MIKISFFLFILHIYTINKYKILIVSSLLPNRAAIEKLHTLTKYFSLRSHVKSLISKVIGNAVYI